MILNEILIKCYQKGRELGLYTSSEPVFTEIADKVLNKYSLTSDMTNLFTLGCMEKWRSFCITAFCIGATAMHPDIIRFLDGYEAGEEDLYYTDSPIVNAFIETVYIDEYKTGYQSEYKRAYKDMYKPILNTKMNKAIKEFVNFCVVYSDDEIDRYIHKGHTDLAMEHGYYMSTICMKLGVLFGCQHPIS